MDLGFNKAMSAHLVPGWETAHECLFNLNFVLEVGLYTMGMSIRLLASTRKRRPPWKQIRLVLSVQRA